MMDAPDTNAADDGAPMALLRLRQVEEYAAALAEGRDDVYLETLVIVHEAERTALARALWAAAFRSPCPQRTRLG